MCVWSFIQPGPVFGVVHVLNDQCFHASEEEGLSMRAWVKFEQSNMQAACRLHGLLEIKNFQGSLTTDLKIVVEPCYQ